MMHSSPTIIDDLNLLLAKDCIKCDIVATTAMSFARTTAIVLFDVNNIKLHTAGMMNYSGHVRYRNDPRGDELYKT